MSAAEIARKLYVKASRVVRRQTPALGRHYDEATYFADVTAGYEICHVLWSNGLTVLAGVAWMARPEVCRRIDWTS